jgi:hypothetical protein
MTPADGNIFPDFLQIFVIIGIDEPAKLFYGGVNATSVGWIKLKMPGGDTRHVQDSVRVI